MFADIIFGVRYSEWVLGVRSLEKGEILKLAPLSTHVHYVLNRGQWLTFYSCLYPSPIWDAFFFAHLQGCA